MAAAKELGKAMAIEGIGLVYGGGGLGLMGEVARSVLDNGGHVTGIIPEFLVNREHMLDNVNELIVTTTMHERKMTMFARASGFVALPGGLGTLEETLEMLTWVQLGIHDKPVAVLNVDGYYDGLLKLLATAVREGFLRREYVDLLLFGDAPAEVLDRVATWRPPAVRRAWLTSSEA
jgi:hypothetical protein